MWRAPGASLSSQPASLNEPGLFILKGLRAADASFGWKESLAMMFRGPSSHC